MSTSDWMQRIDRLQRTMIFKLVATALVVVLGLGFLVNYAVQQKRAADETGKIQVRQREVPRADGQPLDPETVRARAAARADAEADAQYINDVLSRRAAWGGAAVVAGLLIAVMLGFVWLGLGMVAPVLLGMIAIVAWRLKLFSPQDVGFEELKTLDVVLLFIAAVAILTCSFLVLMEALKLLFGRSSAVFAVARNVVNEAVRLRVSLVLIVLLIFGLAAMPGLLDPGTPLRYRVQSFLEYGTGGAFWIIAVLVLFLSVGSVTFEQRDRVIWQTMTKPVSTWEYLLGKWLGVVGVAAVLLMVSASGVFAFTEYLSRQKASGEVRPYVAGGELFIAEDRQILEAQVLAARRTIYPTPPTVSGQELDEAVNERIIRELRQEGIAVTVEAVQERRTGETVAALERELTQEIKDQFRAIEPGKSQIYEFRGLSGVRRTTWQSVDAAAERLGITREEAEAMARSGDLVSRDQNGRLEIGTLSVKPLTLRYKVQAGGNDPRTIFRISFSLPGQRDVSVNEVPLNTMMTLTIPPSVISEDGRVEIKIYNGDESNLRPNEQSITLPADGLAMYYAAGSYHVNFFRVVLVLWMKLAFLAMVAIVASTFLSFPVAAMISFGVLLVAEGASFVWEALNYYDASVDGELVWYRMLIRMVSLPIAWTFKHYSDIMPIQSLADGQLVPWITVAWAVVLLGGASVILYAIGVVIFRRRELATYSGQ